MNNVLPYGYIRMLRNIDSRNFSIFLFVDIYSFIRILFSLSECLAHFNVTIFHVVKRIMKMRIMIWLANIIQVNRTSMMVTKNGPVVRCVHEIFQYSWDSKDVSITLCNRLPIHQLLLSHKAQKDDIRM